MTPRIVICFFVVSVSCLIHLETGAAEPNKGASSRPELAFDPTQDFAMAIEAARRTLPNHGAPIGTDEELQPVVRRDSETAEYTMDRVSFQAERGEIVPGYLLRPKTGKPPFPTMICLRGTRRACTFPSVLPRRRKRRS